MSTNELVCSKCTNSVDHQYWYCPTCDDERPYCDKCYTNHMESHKEENHDGGGVVRFY